jgi:hypothetical protein
MIEFDGDPVHARLLCRTSAGTVDHGRMSAPKPARPRDRNEESLDVKDKHTYQFDLEPAKVAFLEEMVKAHGLPDVGKAVRCLIDYARENPAAHEAIFGDVHCVDCGG